MGSFKKLKTTELEVPEEVVERCLDALGALTPEELEDIIYLCEDPDYRSPHIPHFHQLGLVSGGRVADDRIKNVVLSTLQIVSGGPRFHSPFRGE